jgi:hypothetical protein
MALNRAAWLGSSLAVGLAAFLVDVCPAAENDPAVQELKPAWSLKGGWTGVVGDDKEDTVYALDASGKCLELDSAGKTRREFKLPNAGGSVLRLARWPGDEGQALLAFAVWAVELRTYDLKGTPVWNYPSGIDDVWATTLNVSGAVIVGYNGGVGVHVLDSKGQVRWKSQAIGNVWHVCAGDVWGEGTPQFVTTSAKGQVHIFAGDGSKRADIDAGCYANMVRVGKLSKDDKDATIIVAGTAHVAAAPKTVMITALTSDGMTKWAVHVPAGAQPHVDSAALAPGKPWLAVGMRGGLVHVIDADKGAIIGSAEKQGMTPEVGWAAGNPPGNPVVLVATGSKLNAFNVADSGK